jgi:hypothetical protein
MLMTATMSFTFTSSPVAVRVWHARQFSLARTARMYRLSVPPDASHTSSSPFFDESQRGILKTVQVIRPIRTR